jgi:hypothetical protein
LARGQDACRLLGKSLIDSRSRCSSSRARCGCRAWRNRQRRLPGRQAQTLLEWVKKAEVNSGKRAGVPGTRNRIPDDVRARIVTLERIEQRRRGGAAGVFESLNLRPPRGRRRPISDSTGLSVSAALTFRQVTCDHDSPKPRQNPVESRFLDSRIGQIAGCGTKSQRVRKPVQNRSCYGKEYETPRVDQRRCSRTKVTCSSENASSKNREVAQTNTRRNSTEGVCARRVVRFSSLAEDDRQHREMLVGEGAVTCSMSPVHAPTARGPAQDTASRYYYRRHPGARLAPQSAHPRLRPPTEKKGRTTSEGAVSFETIYPGWYVGRPTHIHFKVLLDDRDVLTGQMYFPDAVNEFIYANTPAYAGRLNSRGVVNANDRFANFHDPKRLSFCAIKEEHDCYAASLVLGVDRFAVAQADRPPREGSTQEQPAVERLRLLIPGFTVKRVVARVKSSSCDVARPHF